MHLDLDFFKSVNDRLGHAAGDYVLQQAARIMLEETRSEDSVARIGGDEFVLIFKGLSNRNVLGTIAARLIARLREPMAFEGETCEVSASIGDRLVYPVRGAGLGGGSECSRSGLVRSQEKRAVLSLFLCGIVTTQLPL